MKPTAKICNNSLTENTPGRHAIAYMVARCVFGLTIITNLRRRLYYNRCRNTYKCNIS